MSNFAPLLRYFDAAAVLIAIRSAVNEPPAPRPTRAQYDPWFAEDPFHLSAYAYVPEAVSA